MTGITGILAVPCSTSQNAYRYLGVEQITNGGYNHRDNAIVEKFMHTLGHMLRIASKYEYNNLKDYHCVRAQLHLQLGH